LGELLTKKTHQGDKKPAGQRVARKYTALNVDDAISSEMGQRKGRTVISSTCSSDNATAFADNRIACVNSEMRDNIRRKVQCMVDDTVTLKELDFYPQSETAPRLYDSAAV